MQEISPELDALACELIAAGAQILSQSEQMPVLLAMDCEEDFLTFEDDTPDECYGAACQQVVEAGKLCSRYAIVYDALIQETQDSEASAALVVEFAERGMEQAWSGYMLYRRADDGCVELSDPLPAGAEETLFED